jgi:imidazolonepropionase-like amidohydrolase
LGTLILKGRIFDGKENLERGVVVVDSEKRIIVDVGPEGDVEEPRDGKVITANGQTILPGLIDAHVHFWGCKVYDLTTWVTTPETLVAL